MSYILPSTLSSYALVSLSKRRRGTPLLHHIIIIIIMTTPTSRGDAHAHAYAQPHGHTPPSRFTPTNNAWRGMSSSSASSAASSSSLLLQCKMLNGPKGPEQRTRHQQLMKGQEAGGGQGRGEQQPRPAFCKFTIMIITSQRFFLVLQLSEGCMREM